MIPKMPSYPEDRKPHDERVKEINDTLPKGKTGAICIDNTEEHKAWYLYELTKYPLLKIVLQGELNPDIYMIKVEKV